MDYRLLELIAPADSADNARSLVEEYETLGIWQDTIDDRSSVIRILVSADRTEALTDALNDRFLDRDGFRVMLFAVEATLPHPEDEEETDTLDDKDDKNKLIGRISREELYGDVTSGSELSTVYMAMVALSTVVAAFGLIRDDVAVIIGAMVIAPLLGPNVSLALAATLGDLKLAARSLKANLAGLGFSLGLAFLMGILIDVNPDAEQIARRTVVSLSDIAIALAAGGAGVLAFTRGAPAAIIGVMVAVALLPPLATTGLLLGSGHLTLAMGSAILTFTNVICINLAGVVTFLVQGIRPRNWWEEENARKATRIALTTWVGLLLIFATIIWFWSQGS